MLLWKTNRKRLICLLKDISASLFLVSAPSLGSFRSRKPKKYIHSGNLENCVFFYSPISPGTDRRKYLLYNCQQSPSKRGSFVSCSLHFPEPTNSCNPRNKGYLRRGRNEMNLCSESFHILGGRGEESVCWRPLNQCYRIAIIRKERRKDKTPSRSDTANIVYSTYEFQLSLWQQRR